MSLQFEVYLGSSTHQGAEAHPLPSRATRVQAPAVAAVHAERRDGAPGGRPDRRAGVREPLEQRQQQGAERAAGGDQARAEAAGEGAGRVEEAAAEEGVAGQLLSVCMCWERESVSVG